MGSGAEYGIHEGPICEEDPLKPQSVYASAKATGTLVAHQYARQHGISIVSLRPFGIYGEAEPRHKLFCEAILTLLDGRPLNLTPGGQCRDYCHVADIATALTMCMADASLTNEIFNVGTGELRSLREYVEHIRALVDPSGEVHFGALPYRKDEVFAPAPDTRRIREKLGWRPLVDLDQGLERTVAWFRANRALYQ
jgi:nucleoside-diphosphate-sugar epimerase